MTEKAKYINIEPGLLLEYKNNNKIHDDESVEPIITSIRKYGFRDPIEVDENMEILAGHGRVAAAKKMGLESIPVIQYFDMDEEMKRGYRIMANVTADFSRYNLVNLKIELEELNDPELIRMCDQFKINLFEEEYDVDGEDIAPIPQDNIPIVQPGDLYQLGNHFILCGDATQKSSYTTLLKEQKIDLIATDPPYNINYKGQGKKTSQGIKNDNMDKHAFKQFLLDTFKNFQEVVNPDTPMYIFHSHKTQKTFQEALEENGIKMISQLIRDKPSINHVGGDYKQKHEPFFYASNGDPEWFGGVYQTTVIKTRENMTDQKLLKIFKKHIEAEKEGKATIRSMRRHNTQDYVHPTQKPVEIMERMFENSSHAFAKVLDPFLGSGTTLIAAEKKQRICYGMELDPKYVEVIIARYWQFTKSNSIIKCLNREVDINQIIQNV